MVETGQSCKVLAMDVNGARVSGTMDARGARVFWVDGLLYVTELTGAGFCTCSAPTPEPVRNRQRGNYVAGDVTIALATCGCTKSAKLAALTHEEMIAAADKGDEASE